MTYNQIVYDIWEDIKANQISDDVDISFKRILYNVNIQRDLWINNEYNKPGRQIDPILIQSLGCVEVITVDEAECCDIITDCRILRTKKKIPAPVVFNDGVELRIGPVKLTSISFSLKSVNEISRVFDNKYAGNLMYGFYFNDYIYLVSKSPALNMIDTIKVWGVFTDPEEADTFADCDTADCFSYDDQYPIKSKLIPYIKAEVLRTLGVSIRISQDNKNNAKDNIV
jgi:hypothetical protein